MDLVLSPAEQSALATLVAAEPVPGGPVPPPGALEALLTLVPAVGMGAVLVADDGRAPSGGSNLPDWPVHDHETQETGPLHVDFMLWLQHPPAAAPCDAVPGGDGIALGCRAGDDSVAHGHLERRELVLSERDLALLRLVAPLLQRLLRGRPATPLPASVTVQERRVLMHVASGASNAEIAQALFIAPSTVRKHLEHVYAKLGVHNRLQALAVLHGSDVPDLDRREHVGRYA